MKSNQPFAQLGVLRELALNGGNLLLQEVQVLAIVQDFQRLFRPQGQLLKRLRVDEQVDALELRFEEPGDDGVADFGAEALLEGRIEVCGIRPQQGLQTLDDFRKLRK